MSLATREQLLGMTKRRYMDVAPQGSGAIFRIQSLTERERSEFELSVLAGKKTVGQDAMLAAKRRLVALVLVDGEGKPLLDPKDADALGEVDAVVISEIFNAAMVHVGLTKGDVDDLVKNSESVHVDGSRTS